MSFLENGEFDVDDDDSQATDEASQLPWGRPRQLPMLGEVGYHETGLSTQRTRTKAQTDKGSRVQDKQKGHDEMGEWKKGEEQKGDSSRRKAGNKQEINPRNGKTWAPKGKGRAGSKGKFGKETLKDFLQK